MRSVSDLLHVHSSESPRRTPSPERPVVRVRDFPKLQTPYLVALPSPENTRRSENGRSISLNDKSFRRRYPSTPPSPSLPLGWISYIHPRGWVYYFHPEHRLVTDYKIETTLGLQEFEAALRDVKGFPVSRLPNRCELWIDHRLYCGRNIAEKLFVDHERRRLTPRAPVHRRGTLNNEDGTWQDEEIDTRQQLLYEQAYWEFIIGHPCHAILPEHAEEDAIAALTWYTQDRLLNPEESIAPYSTEMSKGLLEVLSVMSDNRETFDSLRNGYIKTHLVASILERIAGERIRQHYGQQDARNYYKKTLKIRRDDLDQPHTPPFGLFLSFTMTILCFGTPYSYLRNINDFFITGPGRTDTITERWQAFVDDNVSDWNNTNLVATVLVSASVALLAVPGIDTTTRLLGIYSTLFSIASIIVGLLNVWQCQHQTRSSLELTVIFDFFSKAERLVKTDKLLAVLLSLPMVLLIWATLLFAASMMSFAWLGVDGTVLEVSPDDIDRIKESRFHRVVAWATSGCLGFLTTIVLLSFLYFWRVWKPSSFRKEIKKKSNIKAKH